MSIKDDLTNEQLKDKFENPFQVVNYAIQLAKAKIARGEELDSNPTEEILESLLERPFEEILAEETTPYEEGVEESV